MTDVKVHGLPGAGKTTFGIDKIREMFPPADEILAETFRRRLSNELIEKLGKNYINPPWVTTTHGIAKRTAASDADVIDDPGDYIRFCKDYGVDYYLEDGEQTGEVPNSLGKQLFSTRHYLVHNMMDYSEALRTPTASNSDKGYLIENEIENFCKSWDEWKRKNNKMDFEDMLTVTLEDGASPQVEIYFSDEFQDKTPLMYALFEEWKKDADTVIIAGDPFQTIYDFWGSTPDFFREESADETRVLEKSWRLSEDVWEYATGILHDGGYDDIPMIETTEPGHVHELRPDGFADTLKDKMFDETFVLCRANYQTKKIIKLLEREGIPFYSVRGQYWSDKLINVYNAVSKIREWERPEFGKGVGWKGPSLSSEELDALTRFFKKKDSLIVKRKKLQERDKPLRSEEGHKVFKNRFLKILKGKRIIRDESTTYKNVTSRQCARLINALQRYPLPFIDDLKVFVGTIHSAKGREAKNVFLFDNVTNMINENLRKNIDVEQEARVFFVGATRTRGNLFVIHDYFDTYTYGLPRVNT